MDDKTALAVALAVVSLCDEPFFDSVAALTLPDYVYSVWHEIVTVIGPQNKMHSQPDRQTMAIEYG